MNPAEEVSMMFKKRFLRVAFTRLCTNFILSIPFLVFPLVLTAEEHPYSISIEWSVPNAFTSTFYQPFDGPLGLGWGGVYFDGDPHHEYGSGVMTLHQNNQLSGQDSGDEYWLESETSFFNLVLNLNFSDWLVSAMPFSVVLMEYQDKYDEKHLVSNDGYYSVPTGKQSVKEAVYYSATYPFAEIAEQHYSGGFSYNTYDRKISLVLGMRL